MRLGPKRGACVGVGSLCNVIYMLGVRAPRLGSRGGSNLNVGPALYIYHRKEGLAISILLFQPCPISIFKRKTRAILFHEIL